MLAETTQAMPTVGSPRRCGVMLRSSVASATASAPGLFNLAGQPSPEVGLDARNHGLLSVRVGRVIGSTELALSNLC